MITSRDGVNLHIVKFFQMQNAVGVGKVNEEIMISDPNQLDEGQVYTIEIEQDQSEKVLKKQNSMEEEVGEPGVKTQKQHLCPFCGRSCAKPSVLEKHLRAHTNERPYPCTVCGFAFKTKSNLYKHRKSRAHIRKCMSAVGCKPSDRVTGGIDWNDKVNLTRILESKSMHMSLEEERIMEEPEPSIHGTSTSASKYNPGWSYVTLQQASDGTLKIKGADRRKEESAIPNKYGKKNVIKTIDAETAKHASSKGLPFILPNSQNTVKMLENATVIQQQSDGSAVKVSFRMPSKEDETAASTSQAKVISDTVKDRINRLIKSNDAIIDAPMAEPPRPKSMSRQNSRQKIISAGVIEHGE